MIRAQDEDALGTRMRSAHGERTTIGNEQDGKRERLARTMRSRHNEKQARRGACAIEARKMRTAHDEEHV